MTEPLRRPTSPHRERGFERLVTQTSATVTSVPESGIEAAILQALGDIARFFDVDQIVLSRRQDDVDLRIALSWSATEEGRLTEGLVWSPMIPGTLEKVLRGEVVSFSADSPLDETAEEYAVDRESFREMEEKSHISVPIQVAEHVLGALSLVVRSRDRTWSADLPGRLRLLAELLANAILRRDNEGQISEASERIAGLESLLLEQSSLRDEQSIETGEIDQLIGVSQQIQSVIRHAEVVAQTDATVLLLGETGTGKGLLARLVHRKSKRSTRPLITVNCAALPDTLIESELFGHEKGAFTGALQRRVGRFELADGGTIFLDEVGDLPLQLQAKLLRVLQDHEFERLGSTVTKKVDVRVIAATNRDLATAVEEGQFRADLYYRLRVVPIELSSLRQHREDIPLLLWHFVNKYQIELGKTINRIPQDVVESLMCYDWPGNVRELANVVERAVIFTQGKTLIVDETLVAKSRSKEEDSSTDDLKARERDHITDVLDQCGWKVKGRGNAAERVGLHPSTLRARMKKLGINRPRRVAS